MFTGNRLRSDFDNDLRATAADLQQRIPVSQPTFGPPVIATAALENAIVDVAASGDAALRVLGARRRGGGARARARPSSGRPAPPSAEVGGYRVVTRPLLLAGRPTPAGRRLPAVRARRTALDAHDRARQPVPRARRRGRHGARAPRRARGGAPGDAARSRDLTGRRAGVARTRDPAVEHAQAGADDEVADLARTLEQMLAALDSPARETEATLAREREFVADASHELRTPLTSVLANLELLEADARGRGRARSPGRPCARPSACAGWWPISCSWRAPTPASPRRRRRCPPTSAPWSATRRPRPPRSRPRTRSRSTPPGVVVDGVAGRPASAGAQPGAERGGPHPAREPRSTPRCARSTATPCSRSPTTGRACRRRSAIASSSASCAAPATAGAPRPGGRGSGLGLPIVEAVAGAHGGSVALDEAPGGGARFRVRLPLKEDAQKDETERHGQSSPASRVDS